MTEELFITKAWAEIQEFKGVKMQEEGLLRLYCSLWPDDWILQIRTNKPITGGGVPRNMVATVGVSLQELEAMVEFIKEQTGRGEIKTVERSQEEIDESDQMCVEGDRMAEETARQCPAYTRGF